MTAPVRCPHCGAAISARTNIPDELLKQSLFALTQDATLNSAVLRVLIRYFGNNVSTELIVNACYGSREPPLTVANTIRVRISQLRHVVEPLGLVIVNERFPCSYRLDFEGAP